MSETVYNNEPGNDQVYDETIYGDDTAGQAYDEFGDNQEVYDQDDIIISARNVVKCFPMGNGEKFYALKGLDMDVPRGKLTILKGRSGSGKPHCSIY